MTEQNQERIPSLMQIVGRLTEMQRNAIVAKFTEINPLYQGAHCADILGEMDNYDSNLRAIERACKAHPALSDTQGFATAVRALLWSDTRIDDGSIRSLLFGTGKKA